MTFRPRLTAKSEPQAARIWKAGLRVICIEASPAETAKWLPGGGGPYFTRIGYFPEFGSPVGSTQDTTS